MAVKMTSIRLDAQLADEAAKILGVKSRTEAVHVALSEIVALKRFKSLMKKNVGKLSFDGYVEYPCQLIFAKWTALSGLHRSLLGAQSHIAAELVNPFAVCIP